MSPSGIPNGFSWSATRHGMLQECPRRYFFHYYLAMGRVEHADSRRVAEARRLRHMTTVPMWVGARVHDAIETILRGAQSRDSLGEEQIEAQVAEAVTAMVERMRTDYRDSKLDSARHRNPRHVTRFHEHEYAIDVPDEQWRRVVDDAKQMVHSFARLGYVETTRQLRPDDLLALEELDRWFLDSVPIWVKIDLAYRDGDGTVHIVDWKTGKKERDDNPLQLTGYATFAARSWEAPSDKLAVREVYLRREDPEKWCTIDESTIERAEAEIRA
ncbi:MAG: PD-(D/E)XK nuclease family protein, partial [Acidobacteriota bacterium]